MNSNEINYSGENPDSGASKDLNHDWKLIVEEDQHLLSPELRWYLSPAVTWLSTDQAWREQGEIRGTIDPTFSQPSASTSLLRRIVLEDESLRIVKEFASDHRFYYSDSGVARALMLAGEQALGSMQFSDEIPKSNADNFYQGIYTMTDIDRKTALSPYMYGDAGRIVSVMKEVNSHNTLGMLLFSEKNLKLDLPQLIAEQTRRSLLMELPMPAPLINHYRSFDYLNARIHHYTPGRIAEGVIGKQFPFLQAIAKDYVKSADEVLREDAELVNYLLLEPYARRGGDVRAINTILSDEGDIAVILDQINLLLDPIAWGNDRVEIAPWGMNPPTYEVAFQIPDLIAAGREDLVQVVVDTLGVSRHEFNGLSWNDFSKVEIRALWFWTAMKAIETAGLSTFNIDDDRLTQGGEERRYLQRAIDEYGTIGVKTIHTLLQAID